MTTRESIDDFLGRRRIACIGVSRNPNDFSRLLWQAFAERGYDLVPVHPEADAIDDRPCFRQVQDVAPAVEAALVMTPRRLSAQVLRECAAAGVRCVWLARGAVSPDALAVAAEEHMVVVPGWCPFMFLPNVERFHRFHGALVKLCGAWPK